MEIRVRKLIQTAGIFALVLLVAPIAAFAQSAQFAVSQHGNKVGTASFTFAPNASGVSSTSIVRVSMQGLKYSLSKTETLSPSKNFTHVQLSAIVNDSAVNIVAKPDAEQFLLNISANGRSNTTRLDRHKLTVFLPDFDPGALETLLQLADGNNNRELWAIIPKQAGSIQPIQLATFPDEQGTLDGKPIVVHHLVATISGAATDLFSSPKNQLLQAELTQLGFALVRDGFVLTPPKKPLAPPLAPPPAPAPSAPTQ
jgi:hypothetical protein